MSINNNANDEYSQVHLTVEGRVQGVGFRAFTQRIAFPLNITGWVRNRPKGIVEIVAEGKRPELNKFIQSIQRGPFPGTTRKVVIVWNDALSEFSGFRIRMTG